MQVSALGAPAGRAVQAAGEQADQSSDQSSDQTSSDQSSDQSSADMSSDQSSDQSSPEMDQSAQTGEPDQDTASAPQGPTEIKLALAAELPEAAFAADGGAGLTGAGVHVLPLPGTAQGAARLVVAEAPVEVSLAVEARADGAWRRIGQAQGLAPMLAIPGDGGIGARCVVGG